MIRMPYYVTNLVSAQAPLQSRCWGVMDYRALACLEHVEWITMTKGGVIARPLGYLVIVMIAVSLRSSQ